MTMKLLVAAAASMVAAFSAFAADSPDSAAYPGCEKPVITGEVIVKSAIVIPAGKTLDGGNKRYRFAQESEAPVFVLQEGAALRNAIVGRASKSAVECHGSCAMDHVWWEGAGESAATARGGRGSVMSVGCSGAVSIAGQTFENAGSGIVRVTKFFNAKSGKLYRSCPSCTGVAGSRHADISNVITRDVAIIASVSSFSTDGATIRTLTLNNSNAVPTKICQQYQGGAKAVARAAASVEFDTKHCDVRVADVKLIPPSRMDYGLVKSGNGGSATIMSLTSSSISASVTGTAEFSYNYDNSYYSWWGWRGSNSIHVEYDDIGNVPFRMRIWYLTAETEFAGPYPEQRISSSFSNSPTSVDFGWDGYIDGYYSYPGPGGLGEVTRIQILGQDGSGNYTVVLRDSAGP